MLVPPSGPKMFLASAGRPYKTKGATSFRAVALRIKGIKTIPIEVEGGWALERVEEV